jgi:molybdopterin-guanine dinucleotide biosynthesis protein A
MNEIEGFILAGGASSRMGKDKAFLRVGGKTLIECAADALSAVSANPHIVGNDLPGDLFLPVVSDVRSIGGTEKRASIIGLYSALTHSKSEWTAILACDLPFVSRELFSRLALLGEVFEKNAFEAVAPVQPDGTIQPLCAFYKTAVCLPVIEKMFAANDFRLQGIFRQVNARLVKFSEIADLPNAENFFFNVNTPEDLQRASEIENNLFR